MSADIPLFESRPWLRTFLIGRNPKWTLVRIIVLAAIVFVPIPFVFLPIRVEGISMAPNYRDGRPNLINKWAYRKSKPQRGDVVAIRMAGEHVLLLKRIVGLPGERVSIRQGKVQINGASLAEPYVKFKTHRSWNLDAAVPPGSYFVVGDNRSMRYEFHYDGLAEAKRIVGKVVF